MPKLDIEFAWSVATAGYEVVEPAESGPYLIARGEENRWRNPIADNAALFRRFALLPETAAACTEFANAYGLLFGVGYEAAGSFDRGPARAPLELFDEVHRDRIEIWFFHIRRLRRLVKGWDQARSAGESTAPYWRDMRSPRLLVDLVDRGGKPGLSSRPGSLLSAIDLQFYQAVAGMTELKACQHCGTWFECGPGGARRSASRFCSDICRFNFHNARKGKGGPR